MKIQKSTESGQVASSKTQRTYRNPAISYLMGLREGNTRNTMKRGLQRALDLIGPNLSIETFPWWELRAEHVRKIRVMLIKNYAPQTVNISLGAIRQVLKIAYFQHRMSHRDYKSASDIQSIRDDRPQAGRFVSDEEIAKLLETCDTNTPKGLRDATIIVLLFYGTGLRRAELAKLTTYHYRRQDRVLRVKGKGGRLSDQVLSEGAQQWLERWLDLRGRSHGYLFCEIRRGGNIHIDKPFGPHAVWEMFRNRAREAGIRPLTPHDARRTFISNLLERADLVTVQALARHSNPQTTARYDRRGEAARRDALATLAIPDL